MYQGSPELLKRLDGHRVFVGVCGGIAAYKVASVVSGLVQGGAVVQVAMTDAATKFVTPLTFQSLSGRAVFTSGWDSIDQADPQHVRLAGENEDAEPLGAADCRFLFSEDSGRVACAPQD